MAGVTKDPVLIALLCVFVLTGAISAYYLVLGLREGRIGRKFNFPYRTAPLSDGRDPGYAYRSHSPGLFWNEIGMQVLAVAVSIVMIFILLTAP
jgi:hypothetical protein